MKLPKLGKKTIIALVALLVIGGGVGSFLRFGPKVPIIQTTLAKIGFERDDANDPNSLAALAILDKADTDLESSDANVIANSALVKQVRQIQVELAAMAHGDDAANMRLKDAMIQVRQTLSDPPDTMDGSEVDAVTIYVLSGGMPELGDLVLQKIRTSTRRRQMLEAAIAFVKGDEKVAKAKLLKLDPAGFPPPVAARLLMMQSQLQADQSYEKRRDMLAEAANMMLGTLVEEASTRRLAEFSAAQLVNRDFVYWAQRYERRFPRSLYFNDFVLDLANGIMNFEKNKSGISELDLNLLIDSLPSEGQATFLQALQTAALRDGQKRLCHYAFTKISKRALEIGADYSRARLYDMACAVGEGGIAPEELALLDGKMADPADQQLLKSAALLATGIAFADAPSLPTAYGPQRPFEDFDAIQQLGASVAQQLKSTDKALEGVAQ